MKKALTLIFTLAILCWVTEAFGQIEAGTVYFGGDTDLSAAFGKTKYKYEPKDGDTDESDGPDITSLNFSPSVGFFLINNLAVGIFADISYDKSKWSSDNSNKSEDFETSTTSLMFGPFAKFYIGEGNVKPFAQGSVGFGSSKTKGDMPYNYKSEDEEYTTKLFGWNVGAGIAIFPSDNVSFEFGVGYASQQFKNDDKYDGEVIGENTTTINAFGFNFGIGVFL